jgi:hypothetical protein
MEAQTIVIWLIMGAIIYFPLAGISWLATRQENKRRERYLEQQRNVIKMMNYRRRK